jgi:hypothetical protein
VPTHPTPHLLCTQYTRRIYELYSDYVLKNPFYEVEQVIKCELFDEQLEQLARRYPAAQIPTTY